MLLFFKGKFWAFSFCVIPVLNVCSYVGPPVAVQNGRHCCDRSFSCLAMQKIYVSMLSTGGKTQPLNTTSHLYKNKQSNELGLTIYPSGFCLRNFSRFQRGITTVASLIKNGIVVITKHDTAICLEINNSLSWYQELC